MIVCSCYAVTDRQLREAAAAGVTLKEIEAKGIGMDCGECRVELVKIFTAHAPKEHESVRKPKKRTPPKRSRHEG